MPAFAESKPCAKSIHARFQLTLLVTLGHLLEVDRLDLGGVARRAEGLVTRLADLFHRLDGGGEELARNENQQKNNQNQTQRTRRHQAQNKDEKDLAHAVLDALDDFLDRH